MTTAQECKYSRNEIDHFDGKRILITEPRTIEPRLSNYLSVSAVKFDSMHLLRIGFITSQIVSMDRGNKILLKLTNDEIITLQRVEDYEVANPLPYNKWEMLTTAPLSDDQVDFLLKNGVKMCRIYLDKGVLDYTFKEKHYYDIQSVLKCVVFAY